MSLSLGESTSPILRVIPDYERQFLVHLRRGESFLGTSEQAAVSCRRCVDQMKVQCQALEAAVGNLTDHYKTTQSNFEAAQQKLSHQQRSHKSLLDNFEHNMSRLSRIPLHPSLQGSTLVGGDVECTTLLDTVPVEKEHAWVDKCRQAHQKVEENMVQLQLVFERVTEALRAVDVSNVRDDMPVLVKMVESIESRVETQKTCMRELRESYRNVNESISSIVDRTMISGQLGSGSGSLSIEEATEDESTALVKSLASGARKQEVDVLHPMEMRCKDIMRDKDVIAGAKNKLTSEVYRVMRQVAVIQTDIQFKLKKGLELMKKWRQGHNGYFQHLERIQSLPEAYRDFLYEVIRRKKYTEEFESLVKESVDRISAFRGVETKRREDFMATLGSCLPPLFFDIVPSLVEKPPYFTATVTERQHLPDVYHEDVAALQELGVFGGDENTMKGRNTDSLTSSMSSGDVGAEARHGREQSSVASAEHIEILDPVISANQGEPPASTEDRIKQLELENRHLRRMLASRTEEEKGLSNVSSSQLVAPSSLETILSRLLEDLYGIIDTVASTHTHEITEPVMRAGDEDSPNVDFRLSEALDVIERVNGSIRRAQHAFNEKVRMLKGGNDSEQPDTTLERLRDTPPVVPPTARPTVPTISFLSFELGDIALFLPTNKQDVYLAFSKAKCPNRYLSQDSLRNFKTSDNRNPGYILGKIIYVETKIASKDDPHPGIGPASNPLRLCDGVEYHLLEVEQISFGSSRSSTPKKKRPSVGSASSTSQDTMVETRKSHSEK
eukprot:CAMPEP_0185028656 /NCGR_PEP_ID=MMETSP1103-20130426/14526_1 /TAXON_ID=36769 /ORGANISM="Paraphysomonas bandaiensis, Strain Caron Lab Isolate" /LENGTH=783 /DNA_ID=CAMNT_0027563141 /DNA_START=343 /DNA_END=2694 /DNA_ORIENTATION=+